MHVVVARLTGYLDLLLLETSSPAQKPFKKSTYYIIFINRSVQDLYWLFFFLHLAHIRTGSAGSILLRDDSTHRRFSHEQDHIPKDPFKSPQAAEEPLTFSFDLKVNNREGQSCGDIFTSFGCKF